MSKFLENLERIKKEKKLNNRTLSILTGMPYSTIDGFYKKGTDNIKLSTLKKLAESLNISLDDLLGTGLETNDKIKNYISLLNSEEKERLIKIIELTFPKVLDYSSNGKKSTNE